MIFNCFTIGLGASNRHSQCTFVIIWFIFVIILRTYVPDLMLKLVGYGTHEIFVTLFEPTENHRPLLKSRFT